MATVNEKMTNIADAIRDKTNGTELLTLDDMATGVEEVYNKGLEQGNTEGQEIVWREMIAPDQRKDYRYAFAYWGNTVVAKDLVKPYYKIQPTNAQFMFYYCKAFSKIEAEYYDLSKVTGVNLGYCFSYATWITEIEDIGLGVGGITSLNNTFAQCQNLKKIAKLTVQENTTFSMDTFNGDLNLEYIRFDGVIGKTIIFKGCNKLSLDSVKDIISHLKDYSGTNKEYSTTITFNDEIISVLEAEGATAEHNGVPCSWVELIDNKKWNFTIAN